MKNLLNMEKYQLLHNYFYIGGLIGTFLIGFFTADTYITEVMGPEGGAATSLSDIFNGMVYDSAFLLIIISSILAMILGQEFSGRTIDQEIFAGHTRKEIFVSKLIAYLVAFNIMAIIYPVAGSIREFSRFGIENPDSFFYNVLKAVIYSCLLNSALFLAAIMVCCLFQNTAKAVAVTALVSFVMSLYLGYGMMLQLPVSFLPIYQIRIAVSGNEPVLFSCIWVGFVWASVLIVLSWSVFRKCDLK